MNSKQIPAKANKNISYLNIQASEPECPGRLQLSRDLQAIGCLVMELVLSTRMRTVPSDAPFYTRYQHACKIASIHPHEITRHVYQGYFWAVGPVCPL